VDLGVEYSARRKRRRRDCRTSGLKSRTQMELSLYRIWTRGVTYIYTYNRCIIYYYNCIRVYCDIKNVLFYTIYTIYIYNIYIIRYLSQILRWDVSMEMTRHRDDVHYSHVFLIAFRRSDENGKISI